MVLLLGVAMTGDLKDNMSPGDYQLKVDVHNAKGDNLGELTTSLTASSREWMGNSLGDGKKVLPPGRRLK